jgi:hypothetical protein
LYHREKMKKFKTFVTIENIKENQRISEMIELIREYIEKFVDLNEDTEYYERIKNMLPRMQKMDKDRVKAIYQSISAPMLRETCRGLFKDHGMDPNSDSKAAIASDQFYQKILDSTDEPGYGIALVKQMMDGKAINTKGLMDDASKKFITMDDSSYISAKGGAKIVLDKIYKWFWSWEPAMGSRAVGGGEMALILCHPGGSKGGEKGTGGDVYWPNEKMMIEMKKAGSAGAGWGKWAGFRDGFAYFKETCINAGLPDKDLDEIGLGKKQGFKGSALAEKLAASLNEASIMLYEAPKKMSDATINSMWDTICEKCQGNPGNIKFKCVKQGKTDVNDFMHTWVANGVDAYAKKEGHNVLFLFDPKTLIAGVVQDSQKFYDLQKGNNGPFDYDWDVSWKFMGYEQYVPRLSVAKYNKITPTLDIKDIRSRAEIAPYITAIKNYTKAKLPGASKAVVDKLYDITKTHSVRTNKDKAKMINALDKYYTKTLGRLNDKVLPSADKDSIRDGLDRFLDWAASNK